MKGGYLISQVPDLFDQAARVLKRRGAKVYLDDVDGSLVQLSNESSQLFTLYEKIDDGFEWDFQKGPFVAGPAVIIPPMAEVTACLFECRWEDLVVDLVAEIGRYSTSMVWLLDGDGVVWNSEAVDPARVQL